MMTDRVRRQVLDYLLGALDDAETAAVQARLESDPVYRDALDWARGRLVRLASSRRAAAPPPGLAERTCEFLFDPARRLRAAFRWRSMTPPPALSHGGSRLNRTDAGVAAVIFVIAGLLVAPAIHGMRFQARLTTCQDNLRQVGRALAEYSHKNHDLFPAVPAKGNLAAAGIYAPVLAQDGFLTGPEAVLCPDSPQAQQKDFRVPSLDELRGAVGQDLSRIQHEMGGSYGYCLGYFDHGVYQPTRNLNRDYFAIMADAPTDDRPDHQSGNHGGLGQNVLFEDMHVEFCSTTRPGIGNDDIYANDDNEVAPGLHCDDSVIASSGTAPAVHVGASPKN
jgi:anti-sigma factor RsiW